MAIRAKTPAAAPRTTVRTTQPAATATPAQAQPAFITTATATPNGEASAFVKDESAPHTAPSMRHATKRLEVPMPNSMNDGPQADPSARQGPRVLGDWRVRERATPAELRFSRVSDP